ncbi:MAG: Gfo/Idh/MocA family oxidoreductase, partial [Clostridia bacterium]|nr:Gfo/Idh/MocA family oxidoreductase [Clostridia bacterium]
VISVAIIGCGGRGLNAFGIPMQTRFSDMFNVVSVCDINPEALNNAAIALGIDKASCFLSEDTFFSRKRADLLVIATQDRDHVRHILKALELGYDIMAESPSLPPARNVPCCLKRRKTAVKRCSWATCSGTLPPILKWTNSCLPAR